MYDLSPVFLLQNIITNTIWSITSMVRNKDILRVKKESKIFFSQGLASILYHKYAQGEE